MRAVAPGCSENRKVVGNRTSPLDHGDVARAIPMP